jgi:hypothetical protein
MRPASIFSDVVAWAFLYFVDQMLDMLLDRVALCRI